MLAYGLKLQTFEDEGSKIFRIAKYKGVDGDGTFRYSLRNVDDDKTFRLVTEEDVKSKYVIITPDAFLNVIIAKEPAYNSMEVEDVYFCVNKASDIVSGIKNPSLVLRQNWYSSKKNLLAGFGEICVGELLCTATETQEEVSSILTYEEIKKFTSVAIYLDDSLDTILSFIPNKFKKDINATLQGIASTLESTATKGVCKTYEQLLKENDFMANMLAIFNIAQIDFPIVLGEESYNNDGDIILNSKQIQHIEDLIRRYIENVKVIKYDKDLDISRIVSNQHIMVKDSDNEMYLIAYDVTGYYVDSDTEDILKSMTKNV